MFERDLFMLNASVADAVKSVGSLKKLFGGLQQYDQVAQLRDIELHLETVEKALPYYPYPVPNQYLKPGGELYFKQLFTYAAQNCWHITTIFTDAFKSRKARLNEYMQFTEGSALHLTGLNQKLANVETRAIAFLDFLNDMINGQASLDVPGGLSTLNILLKCYTNNSRYASSYKSFDHQKPFYLFKMPVITFLNNSDVYGKTVRSNNPIENDFLKQLPLDFADEKVCYLFFTLANEGLLAWEDILNIDKVEMVINVGYRFLAK